MIFRFLEFSIEDNPPSVSLPKSKKFMAFPKKRFLEVEFQKNELSPTNSILVRVSVKEEWSEYIISDDKKSGVSKVVREVWEEGCYSYSLDVDQTWTDILKHHIALILGSGAVLQREGSELAWLLVYEDYIRKPPKWSRLKEFFPKYFGVKEGEDENG